MISISDQEKLHQEEQSRFWNRCMEELYRIGLFQIASGRTFPDQYQGAIQAHYSNLSLAVHQGEYGSLKPPSWSEVEAIVLKRLEGLSQSDAYALCAPEHSLLGVPAEEIQPPEPVSVQTFPTYVFPETIQVFVEKAAKALNVPEDFIGLPVLVIASVAIGNSRKIQLKKSWIEAPRIYAGIVADPGSKKSPALKLAMEPIYRMQSRLNAEYQSKKEQYKLDLAEYEIKLANWKNQKNRSAYDKPEEPREPQYEQIYTTDSTVESLADLMSIWPRGLLFFQDELSKWVHSMNQYKGGKGGDKEFWLSAWNGAPVVINRKSMKEPINIPSPFVSVLGAIPPDILGDLSTEQDKEDGFIHRILLCYPDPQPLKYTDDDLEPEIVDAYSNVIMRLLEIQDEEVLSLDEKAKINWIDWINQHYQEMNDPLFPSFLRGPWAKLEGYCARLALIIHMLRVAAGEANGQQVDFVSVGSAGLLVDYFKTHLRKAYDRLQQAPEDKRVTEILEWIRKNGGKASRRDIITYKVAKCKKNADVDQLFAELQERGYGEVITLPSPSGRGRPSVTFRLFQ